MPGTEFSVNRQFTPATVSQHGKPDVGRAAIVEQFVDGGACRAAGVEHVIDKNQRPAFDIEGQGRGAHLGMQAALAEIVAIEGNVEQADFARQAEQFVQTAGNPGATAMNADDQGRFG